jgi:adenine-specific DNA methylase
VALVPLNSSSFGRKDPNRRVPNAARFELPWSSEPTAADDYSFHQIAPYIGRMKTSMARSLIETWTRQGDLIVDPFCGCGTVAVEAAANGRGVVAGDWNPYAALLTRAKLFPPAGVRAAERRLQHVWKVSRERLCEQDLRTVPKWVRQFFHPRTLRSTLAVRDACVETSSINIRR